MAERQRGWAVWAIAALAVAAIAAGLALTGGPFEGRVEQRDNLRGSDLAALARQARCIFAAETRADGDLAETATCPDSPRLQDPFTGAPYRIEPLDARHLRLCADFEREPARHGRHGPVPGQWQGDCVVVELGRPD